jgi:hypothetical protein
LAFARSSVWGASIAVPVLTLWKAGKMSGFWKLWVVMPQVLWYFGQGNVDVWRITSRDQMQKTRSLRGVKRLSIRHEKICDMPLHAGHLYLYTEWTQPFHSALCLLVVERLPLPSARSKFPHRVVRLVQDDL